MARNATAPGVPTTRLGKAAVELDERFVAANWFRRTLNKVYPDHWSFLLGEIALYSFVVLLLSGTYLTFFFDASMREVVYDGSYAPLRGVSMSAAYESTLHMSFDVRGGLFMRQLHHWAALLFVAAIMVHLLRIFFTGAFRRPRETNWLIGVGLLVLGLLEGFAGYTIPDDLLSGTGLRIFMTVILSIPILGTWVYFALLNGDYPGEFIVGRLYIIHVLLVPAILVALITVHLLLLIKQKHTQFPGPGRTEHNVFGNRFLPVFAAKSGGLFFMVFGVCAALGGLVQINPIRGRFGRGGRRARGGPRHRCRDGDPAGPGRVRRRRPGSRRGPGQGHGRGDRGRRWQGSGRGRRRQRRRAGRGRRRAHRRGAGRADRPGQQRGRHPRQHAVQDDRVRLGHGHERPLARRLPDDPRGAEVHDRGQVRPDREPVQRLGAGQPRPGQLLDRQGRPAGLHQDDRDRAGQVRRHRQRDRPGLHPDRDDQGDRRAHGHPVRRLHQGRCLADPGAARRPARGHRAPGLVPGERGRGLRVRPGDLRGRRSARVRRTACTPCRGPDDVASSGPRCVFRGV